MQSYPKLLLKGVKAVLGAILRKGPFSYYINRILRIFDHLPIPISIQNSLS